MEWSVRSPDLSPRVFLWIHSKSVVHNPQLQNLEELRERITEIHSASQRDVFEYVLRDFEQRLYNCWADNGQHFHRMLLVNV